MPLYSYKYIFIQMDSYKYMHRKKCGKVYKEMLTSNYRWMSKLWVIVIFICLSVLC